MGLLERVAPIRTDQDEEAVTHYRRVLLEELDLREFAALDEEQRTARLERTIGELLSRDGPMLSTGQRTQLVRNVIDAAVGLGVLEPLLADPSITEIMVNGPDQVYVERGGQLEPAGVRFASEADLRNVIDRIVSRFNRRVDESSPMVDARLPTGERVNVVIPPLALRGPTVTIRRFPRKYSLAELVATGSLDQATADLLRAFVRARLNLVISGGTGAGKTTLLNALSEAVPGSERVITVEDNAELQLRQPHVISLEARPPNVEGRGQVTIRDLVRNSLRMRPDRIIVGEVRGAETIDMLQAMNTGHEGSLVTVHANSGYDALHRLQTLATMSELEVPYEALRDQINGAIDVVVHIARDAGGARRVAEAAALTSKRSDSFALEPLMELTVERPSPESPPTVRPRRFPLPDHTRRRLERRGIVPPPEFTDG
ncbi:MAG TPA: CpaF family protein [Thermoleophilaceae bacterium]|jgi:pilus assembly protein CpaF